MLAVYEIIGRLQCERADECSIHCGQRAPLDLTNQTQFEIDLTTGVNPPPSPPAPADDPDADPDGSTDAAPSADSDGGADGGDAGDGGDA